MEDVIDNEIQFQSTLPMRGETEASDMAKRLKWDFNPLSPCGERLTKYFLFCGIINFNPLSPCGERLSSGSISPISGQFQSTLPMREET